METEIINLKAMIFDLGLKILHAGFILFLGILAAKLARRWLSRMLDRSRISSDLLLKSFFLRALSFSIIILAGLTALSKIGWDVWTFVAGLGVTGIILGFGLKDTLSNFAAGLMLLIYRPFRAGETIEVEGSQGIVQELTIVNMEMVTTDGVRVIMPNSKVWGAKIINYSLSQRRRLDLTMKVHKDSAEHAIEAILSALSEDKRILDAPAPSVRVTSINDNAAVLTIWAWVNPELFQEASGDQYIRLLSALKGAQIEVL